MAVVASRFIRLDGEPPSPLLTVTSNPSGAQIVIDGVPSQRRTPAEVKLKPGGVARVAVELPGFIADPSEQSIQTSSPIQGQGTSLHFELKEAGQGLAIRTEPPGATVAINGIRQRKVTPVANLALAAGETATVSISMDGYLPVQWLVTPGGRSSTTTHVALEAAASMDVTSEPAGARVLIDGAFRGETPLYEVLVPKNRPFTLDVQQRGFKPWRKRLQRASVVENALQVVLEPMQLLAMPLSENERREALEIARKQSALDKALAHLEKKLRALDRDEAKSEVYEDGTDAKPQKDLARRASQDPSEALRHALFELRAQRAEQDAKAAALRKEALARPEAAANAPAPQRPAASPRRQRERRQVPKGPKQAAPSSLPNP